MIRAAVPFVQDLARHPRRFWLRRAVFQAHLWVGLATALYLLLISASGTLLVFKDEIVRARLPGTLHVPAGQTSAVAPPQAVLRQLAEQEPGATAGNLQFPSPVLPVYLLEGKDAHGRAARWFADPATGKVEPAPRSWVDWVLDLHTYLLLPQSWGMQANGVGALLLLVLAGSGLVLWWQGTRVWTRGLRVNLRARWRRVNYDLHSAIGFWTLLIVVWWAFSGVYFAWYRQVTAAVGMVSPVVGMASPAASAVPATPGAPASLALVLAGAQQSSPHSRVWSVSNPQLLSDECYVLLDRARAGDFSHRDIVRVGRDGRVLSVWHYGERHTLADWILWSMHPLHFGTLWGFGFKLLWAAFGLALAVLTVTGALLYWNRYLGRLLLPGKERATGPGV